MNNDLLRSAVKLLLVFLTITVFLYSWITGGFSNTLQLTLVIVLSMLTIIAFLFMNLWERKERRQRRKERESRSRGDQSPDHIGSKRSDTSFSLREKKSGLTWGGGNIKASEATRGTKRKFLGR